MKDKYRVIVAMMIFMIGEYVVEEKKKQKRNKNPQRIQANLMWNNEKNPHK